MSGINKIKHILPGFCGLFRLDLKWPDIDWCVDYKQDLDEKLKSKTASLQIWINVLEEALRENDLVAAMVAIVRVRIYSLSLYGFFINIFEDMERVGLMLPEGGAAVRAHEVSEIYSYSTDLKFNGLNFNKIKKLIPLLCALSAGGAMDEWRVDYLSNLDEKFIGDLTNLQINLDLMEKSMREGGLVVIMFALKRAQSSAKILSDFFRRIFDDIEKAGWPDDKPLADIPEGYELPARYNYSSR